MNLHEICEARRAEPFQPFLLRLDDGRGLLVEDPYHLAISAGDRLARSSYGHKIRLDSTFFLIRRIRLPLRVLGRISLMAHDL